MVHGFLSMLGMVKRAEIYFDEGIGEIKKMATVRDFPETITLVVIDAEPTFQTILIKEEFNPHQNLFGGISELLFCQPYHALSKIERADGQGFL